MTWLTPLAGVILFCATVPPLVALYFLKLRRASRPIASTLLWKRSLEDIRANAPFQRLRFNILLFLQLLVLALLAFALAQPQVDAGLRRGGKTVLLIDNSASMNATDVDAERAARSRDGSGDGSGARAENQKTRLDLAKELAIAKVEKLFAGGIFGGGSGEVMVIAFAERADVCCPFSDSRAQIIDAIRRIEPTDGRTKIGEALALARAFTMTTDAKGEFAGAEPAALELFSDGRIEDLGEQALRGDEALRYTMMGSPDADNAGVVALAAERSPDSPDRIQVFAGLGTGNASSVTTDVQLSVDGNVVRITPEPVVIPAATTSAGGTTTSGREQVVFTPIDQPREAVIEVAIPRADDLAVDNAAALTVPPARRLRVALVGAEGFVIRSLLEGMALEGLVQLSPEEFEASWTAGGADAYDVFVLQNYTPSEGKTLPPGRYLSFAGVPLKSLNAFGEHERSRVKNSRDEHPAFRFVNLDDLFVSRAQAISPLREYDVLAESADGPLIVALDQGGIRMIHVAFDPLESNWPFLRAFVNFVPNALEWLGAAGEALALAGLEPGETASFRIPANAANLALLLPDGSSTPITVRDPGQFSWGPIRRAGIYALSWDEPGREGRQTRRFAANLLSVAEGRIVPLEKLTLGEKEVVGARGTKNARSALWPALLGLALLMVLIEWWVYQRRTAG
ncbi:MAG: VWA domain-containing protein [Phycisphaerae bacterium]|nr:VWA domain-containing protein [Phycisphaerae bacterium]